MTLDAGGIDGWAAKRPDLRIVAQVPDDPQPLGIGFGKNQAGAFGCCERRTRGDAAGQEHESTQGEVGSAVSDGQTREFVTHAPNKGISPRRFSRAKSEDATRREF